MLQSLIFCSEIQGLALDILIAINRLISAIKQFFDLISSISVTFAYEVSAK